MLICLLALQTSKMPGAEYLNISPSFKAGADPIPSWRNPGVIAAGGVDGPGNYGKWIAQDPNDAQDQHDDMFLCLEANHTWVGNHWQRSIWIGTTLQWIYHCQSNRDEESKDKDTTQVEDSVKVHPSARHALQKPNHKDQAQTYRAYHELPHKSHSGTVNAMNARDPNDVQIKDHHLPYLKKKMHGFELEKKTVTHHQHLCCWFSGFPCLKFHPFCWPKNSKKSQIIISPIPEQPTHPGGSHHHPPWCWSTWPHRPEWCWSPTERAPPK